MNERITTGRTRIYSPLLGSCKMVGDKAVLLVSGTVKTLRMYLAWHICASGTADTCMAPKLT